QGGGHRDHGEIDLGEQVHAQPEVRHQPQHDGDGHQHPGEDRAADADVGNVHGRVVSWREFTRVWGASLGAARTAPGVSAARTVWPLVMTCAPRGRAGLVISTHSVVCTPRVTCTCLARPFSARKILLMPAKLTTAVSGTVAACASRRVRMAA